MMTGAYQLHDTHGLPIDVTFEMAKERGVDIDWCEALCQCWLNDCLKFSNFSRQATMLTGVDMEEKFKSMGAMIVAENPEYLKCENPVDEVCKHVLRMKGKNP